MEPGNKRRRPSLTQEDREAQITGKVHHCLKDMHQAAKRAKGFETQKLVKRIKELRKSKDGSTEEIRLCESQLVALKKLNPNTMGALALATKVRKDRNLAANPHILAALENHQPIRNEAGSPSATVYSRFLSSKVLSVQAKSAMNILRHFLNPPALTIGSPAAELPDAEPLSKKAKMEPTRLKTPPKATTVQGSEDDGWESGSVHHDDAGAAREQERERESDAELTAEESSEEYSEDSSNDDLDVQNSTLNLSKPSKSATQSTFLPSLSVGFIPGNSDSDWSDVDDDANDESGGRKNRRGQRARRAIWEKKFGKGANHTKKQAEEEARKQLQPNLSWSRSTAHSNTNLVPIRPRSPGRTSTAADKVRPLKQTTVVQTEDRPLHPSWEAKRRLKERQAGVVPAQGTKIKF